MTNIYLVRHGQTDTNSKGILAGWYPSRPTELGLRQGEAAAEYLKNVPFDAVYSSDIERAMVLAGQAAALHGLPVIPDPDLRELWVGEWEGRPVEELKAEYPEAFGVWMTDPGFVQCPGGESTTDVTRRVTSAVHRIAKAHPGGTVLCVTHGFALRALYAAAEGIPFERFGEIPYVANAAVTRIGVDEDGAITVYAYGESEHLEGILTQIKWIR